MTIRYSLNIFNLILAIGAVALGTSMILGNGAFDEFPQDWVGVLPFTHWVSLGVFGIVLFGIGNASVALYGFYKNEKKVFLLTIVMGLLLLLCALSPIILLGAWYLPTIYFFIAGLLQLILGLTGLIATKR